MAMSHHIKVSKPGVVGGPPNLGAELSVGARGCSALPSTCQEGCTWFPIAAFVSWSIKEPGITSKYFMPRRRNCFKAPGIAAQRQEGGAQFLSNSRFAKLQS